MLAVRAVGTVRTVDYKDLEAFAVVIAAGSIRAAALQLNLSEPSVSRRMGRLEHALGTALLDRSTRGVVPTSAGRLLLPYIERGKHLLDEMFAAMNRSGSAVRLTAWSEASLAPVVMTFLCHALGDLPVELSNRVASQEKVLSAVVHGAGEVAFAPRVAAPDGITSVPFLRDELTCVVRRDHELAARRRVTLADLAAHDVAIVDWGTGTDDIASQLGAEGLPPHRLRWVTPATTAAMLALYRDHVGVSTRTSFAPAVCEGLLVELPVADLPSFEVEVHLMFRRSDADNPAVQAVHQAVGTAWRVGALPHVGLRRR